MRFTLSLGSLSTAALLVLGVALARADDRPGVRSEDARVDAARASIAAAVSAVAAWTDSESGESELRKAVLALTAPETSGAIVSKPGLALDAAAQTLLASEEQYFSQVASLLARRRRELREPQAAASEPPPPELLDATFDILQVSVEPPDHPAPTAGLSSSLVEGAGEVRPAARTRGVTADNLGEVVRTLLEGDAGSSVTVENGVLFVRASAPVMVRVRALLALFREASTPRIGLDLRAYRMPRELFHELEPLHERVGAATGLALSTEGERVLAEAVSKGRAQLVAGQTLVARDGQLVHAWRGHARTYVAGLDANLTGVVPALNSLTKRLNTGLMAELRPVVDPTSTSVTVSILFSLSGLPGPIEKVRIMGYDVELPEVSISRTGTTLAIPLGRGALIGGSFTAPGDDAKPGEKSDALEVPEASVLYVKPTLVSGGQGRAIERALPARAREAAPHPDSPPPVDLSPEEKDEVERLGRCLAILEPAIEKIRLARVFRWELVDVRDLLGGQHDLVFGDLGLQKERVRRHAEPATLTFGENSVEDAGEGAIGPDRLVELLKASTGEEDGWGEPAYLSVHRGSLLVRNTPGTLSGIHAVLDDLRRKRPGLVQLEACLYRLEPALLLELEAAAAADGSSGGAIPSAALKMLDQAVAKGEGGAFLGGGFLVARSGERVYLHQGMERTFVSDFETVASGVGTIVEKVSSPVVSVFKTGFKLDIRVTQDEDSQQPLSVEANVSRARLREIGKCETPNGAIQTPAIDIDEANASASVGRNQGVLVVTHGTAGKTGVVALVIRVRSFGVEGP